MNNDSMNKQELNEEELDTVAGGIWEIYHESTEIKPGSFVQKKGNFTFKTRKQAEQMFARMDQKRPGYYQIREIKR